MSQIKISVVICTFNGYTRGFLGLALSSVYNQILQPTEVILVDDGSTDKTTTFVSENYVNVKIITKSNAGLPAARNTGVGAAVGDWIAFLDDDDVWYPEKLQSQVFQFCSTPDRNNVIFASRIAIFSSESNTVKLAPPPLHLTKWPSCLISTPVTAPSGVLISRNLIETVGPFNENLAVGEDHEYWSRCIKLGAKVKYSKSVLLGYRNHPLQMTAGKKLLINLIQADRAVNGLLSELTYEQSNTIKWARCLKSYLSLLSKKKFEHANTYFRAARPNTFSGVFTAFIFIGVTLLSGVLPNVLSQFLLNRSLVKLSTGAPIS